MNDDLRLVLAAVLDGLTTKPPYSTRPDASRRLWLGARTLRWCATHEAVPTDDELTELEHLRELVEQIDDVLDEKLRAADFRAKIQELVR